METTRISIIVPAYNIEPYLARCLDSLVAQTYENLEIIVVNDGSRDGSAAVMDAYAARDSRIRAIHKENGGVTSARLRGVAEATGNWIGFVDGDDQIEPDMYERLMANALKYDADISHCGYQMVFPSRVDYYHNTGVLAVHDRLQGLEALLKGTQVEPALWNKLYRRELFAGLADWMDPTIRINEDVLMNCYLFDRAEKTVYEDVCLYRYMLRAGSAATSRLNEHKLHDPLRVARLLHDYVAGEPRLRGITAERLARQLIAGASMADADQRELIAPHRRECRRELRKFLPELLAAGLGKKEQIMALWTAVWPWSYGFVHRVYAKRSGIDRKYEIS